MEMQVKVISFKVLSCTLYAVASIASLSGCLVLYIESAHQLEGLEEVAGY